MQQPTMANRGPIAHLVVDDAAAALEFYRRAFAAQPTLVLPMPDRRVAHAELSLAGGRLMLADPFPEAGCVSPEKTGPASLQLVLYVEDVDAACAQAIESGATLERSARDEFYGERVAQVRDPFGYRWSLHTVIEALTPDQIRARMSAGA